MQDIPRQISITFDAWTSGTSDPYLAVTAHYINSPDTHPNDWALRLRILGYTEIQGNHSGANTAAVILHVVDRYGIQEKVCNQSNARYATNAHLAWMGYIG